MGNFRSRVCLGVLRAGDEADNISIVREGRAPAVPTSIRSSKLVLKVGFWGLGGSCRGWGYKVCT